MMKVKIPTKGSDQTLFWLIPNTGNLTKEGVTDVIFECESSHKTFAGGI